MNWLDLMPLAIGLLWSAGAVWLLFVFFLAVMALQAARDRGSLTGWGKRIGYSVLVVGYLLDFIVQVTVAIAVFAELPPFAGFRAPIGRFPWLVLPTWETTVSSRVKRLIATDTGWRKVRAEWCRDQMLKPFDVTGRHG